VSARTWAAGAALALAVAFLPPTRADAEGTRAPSSWAVVNSSHHGAVLDVASDDTRKLLFTVGDDGTLRIWSQSPPTENSAFGGALVKCLPVTHLAARMLAVNPARPQVAVIESDGISNFAVSAWDWEKEKLLFRIPLKEEPLFVEYSPGGDALLFGATRFEGPRVVNASSGTPAGAKTGTTGIAGFAELSRSGTTLMTYRMDGRIVYADTASGRIVQEASTVPFLRGCRITRDKRWLLGRTADQLVCLDLLGGAPALSVSGTRFVSADISPAGDTIAAVTEDGTVSRWVRDSGSWRREELPRNAAWQTVLVRFGGDSLYFGGPGGQIDAATGTAAPVPFARDLLAQVDDIAVQGSMLAVAGPGGVRLFDLSGEDGAVEKLHAAPSFAGPLGVRFITPSALLVWGAGDAGGLGILDTQDGAFRPVGRGETSGVLSAQVLDGTLYVLQKDGTVKLVALPTGAVTARFSRPGAAAVSPLPHGDLAVAHGPQNQVAGSLLRIDAVTGETVALPTPNLYTYALHYDAKGDALYSLGVDASGQTNLVKNPGPGFQSDTVIDTAAGEYLSASLALDKQRGVIYSTIGRTQVVSWNGASRSVLPASARVCRTLSADGGILAALWRDSTVRLWDAAGRAGGQLALFADGGWASIRSDGRVTGSQNAAGRVIVYNEGLRAGA
jgi:WD40 repeat protein